MHRRTSLEQGQCRLCCSLSRDLLVETCDAGWDVEMQDASARKMHLKKRDQGMTMTMGRLRSGILSRRAGTDRVVELICISGWG